MFEPHQAILVPALIAYTFFIVLSVLQLQPWITVLMTILASGQYMGLVVIADRHGAFEAAGSLPDVSMYTMPVTLAMSGICAVFVAVRVRGYVEAAVREEARRASAEREIRAASDIQASVLPATPPRVSGFAVSGWNRQAELAGGDYYDWIELPSGQVVVSLADVAGHGLGPALVTASCRAYARSQFRRSAELAPAIGELNALLAADLPPGRFVTFVAVVLTPDTDDVSVLSAGHGPVLCYRAATGDVESWGADELPIGVEESIDAGRGTTVTLGRGDAIVLITDGFFEWRNPNGEQWGTGRLREALARHGTLAPDELIAALVGEVEAFAGAPQDDDLSAVIIRRTAPT
jgi:serine phosphatase RsbU (regulator of sigma subunit)